MSTKKYFNVEFTYLALWFCTLQCYLPEIIFFFQTISFQHFYKKNSGVKASTLFYFFSAQNIKISWSIVWLFCRPLLLTFWKVILFSYFIFMYDSFLPNSILINANAPYYPKSTYIYIILCYKYIGWIFWNCGPWNTFLRIQCSL